MSDELKELQAMFERAQQKPPEVALKRSVLLPQTLRPSRDSRGQMRPVPPAMAKARQHQIDRARREMLGQARDELLTKAKEQLKP